MSSGITLSAATRQNLLSLQGTADLLSTTQNRLSTGKKVNTALDSPVNFFTSQSLNSRSSDLTSLLDGIGNGIQTIQAADKGITALKKLTDQLKSTAQQALSATSAFTSKAALSSKALNGAVDTNLLSTGATEALGNTAVTAAATTGTDTKQLTTGTVTLDDPAILALTGTKTLNIDSVDIKLDFDTTIATQADLTKSINDQLKLGGSDVVADFSGNNLRLSAATTTSGAFNVDGTNAADLFGATPVATASVITAASFTGSLKATALGFKVGDSFNVNGSAVEVSRTDTVDTLAAKVATATNGDVSATFDAGTDKFTFKAKDAKTEINLSNGPTTTGTVSKLGFSTLSFDSGKGKSGSTADLSGKVLTVSVGSGNDTKNVTVTFGTQTGQVKTVDQLNDALASANAQASIDSTGHLKITTTNDSGSQDLRISGNATTGTGSAFFTSTATATVGGDGETARGKLVNDYNNLLNQIDQLSSDSSFNGVNLLRGDQLKVDFNREQTSSITVKGKATNADTLGLKSLTANDFVDNTSINKVFSSIKSAGDSLQSQASTYASNLSVVQNRQDFSKNLINVLDTGSANLTNADLNEEAANSQALSTRNSLAISALGLANTAQQGILQLLR